MEGIRIMTNEDFVEGEEVGGHIVRHQSTHLSLDMSFSRKPAKVIEEAREAAAALKAIIDSKPTKVVMGGETYIEFEDWQMLGRFYGITTRVVSTNYVQYGDVHGFEAEAESIIAATGQVVGRAQAMCLNDEDKWGKKPKYRYDLVLNPDGSKIWEEKVIKGVKKNMPKSVRVLDGYEVVPLFQLRSMAQTRAMAKAFRSVLGWVAVLAGYRATPAEELDGVTNSGNDEQHTGGTERQQATGEQKQQRTVQQPQATGEQQPKPQEARREQPKQQEAAKPQVETMNLEAVEVTDCQEATGVSAKGEWRRCDATFSNGVKGSTFSDSITKTLFEAEEMGFGVNVQLEKGSRGWVIKGITGV